MKAFYLGSPFPNWLEKSHYPLFVSYQRLRERKRVYHPLTNWALDSGGFTELSQKGKWTISPAEYVKDVRRYCLEFGSLDFAAPQDWMCEDHIIKKTGLSVKIHQERTIDNFLELKSLAPDLPFIPVLQGFEIDSYLSHFMQYLNRGIDLRHYPRVGVGSVCRRQSTAAAHTLLTRLHGLGIKIHAFGFKVKGLRESHDLIESSDSMAWSFQARKRKASGQDPKASANSLEYALTWRARVLSLLDGTRRIKKQLLLF